MRSMLADSERAKRERSVEKILEVYSAQRTNPPQIATESEEDGDEGENGDDEEEDE